MTDDELFKLMLHHIRHVGMEDHALRVQRQAIIESEMVVRERRATPYQTIVQVGQIVPILVGQCGQGDDARFAQSGFEVKPGDQLLVYRGGG